MSLSKFWPLADLDHAKTCIFTDAETAPDAVFLAVHQPMILMRKNYQSDEDAVEQTELQILDEFIRENPSSGTVVMPIIGDSAVGKSHMIRWIDAHMRMNGLGENRHIVRIPKSASMKTVLGMILENLEGDEYSQLREDLKQARLPKDSDQARYDLRSNLTGALERTIDYLRQKVVAGAIAPDEQRRLSHATGLINLLDDIGVREHFLRRGSDSADRLGVFTRIVHPLLHDSHDVDQEQDNHFQLEDFDFVLEGLDTDLAPAARPYFNRLARKEEQRREAVETLNELRDEALNGLIDFSGDSLPDLFKKVRAGLLRQGQELVLLIEDFAMLGGIQQQLLDAVTDPAIGPQGEQRYCIMRTAIAVTEGRLDEATVLTRAGASWKIRSRPFSSGGEALTVFTNMVGGYLNAARHGVTELKRQLKTSSGNEVEFTNYLDEHGGDLSEEEMNLLASFGYSPTGRYPLFPFNQNAIRQIMESKLKQEGEFQFKPRFMNHVVRETVINYRKKWQDREFPTAGYQQFTRNKLGNEVNQYLNRTSEPERTAALLGYWGACPRTLEAAASVPVEIYEAFGMHPVDWGSIVPATTAPATTTPTLVEPNGSPSAEPTTEPARVLKWLDCLDRWKENRSMGQRDAAQLRNMIADAIRSWIDTDPLMLRELDIDLSKIIYLPHARTGNPDDLKKFHILTATEEQLEDSEAGPQFFLAMESVIQFHERKNWNYSGSEKDYARYTNFIERIAADVETHMRDFGAKTLPNESVTPLVHSLIIGARILNLEKASSSSHEGMIEALLNPGPPPDNAARGNTTRWDDLKHATTSSRLEMRKLLLSHVAARQGGGDVEHAVDASAIIPALETLKKQDWQLVRWEEDGWRRNLTASRDHINDLRTQLPSILKDQIEIATVWAAKVEEFFGESFNMDEIAVTLRETISSAMNCGTFRYQGGKDPKPLRDLISDVKKRPVKSCFDEATLATGAEGQFGTSLSAIGRLDLLTISKTKELIDAIERFLSAVETEAEAKLVDAPRPKEAAERLATQLETTCTNWNSIATRITS